MYNTDRAKWMNHSARPNLVDDQDRLRAARRIRKGEEMTENYCVASGRCRRGAPCAEVRERTSPPQAQE